VTRNRKFSNKLELLFHNKNPPHPEDLQPWGNGSCKVFFSTLKHLDWDYSNVWKVYDIGRRILEIINIIEEKQTRKLLLFVLCRIGGTNPSLRISWHFNPWLALASLPHSHSIFTRNSPSDIDNVNINTKHIQTATLPLHLHLPLHLTPCSVFSKRY